MLVRNSARQGGNAREKFGLPGSLARGNQQLVSELRLADACTAAEATSVLESYRPAHNKRFALAAQDANQAWRPSPGSAALDTICALQHTRLVANNNTVRVNNVLIDIPRKPRGRSYAKTYVTIRHLLDGRYEVYFGGECIAAANGAPPIEAVTGYRSETSRRAMHDRARKKREQR
jgi:hypothetical protein